MGEPLVYTVEIDRDRLEAVRPMLVASILGQNRKFRDRHRSGREKVRKLGLAIAIVGCVLVGLLVGLSLFVGKPIDWTVIAYGAVFATCAAIFFNGARFEALLDGLPPRTIAWQVGRALTPLLAKAPYAIDYAVDELGVTAKSDGLGVDKRIPFEQYRFAVCTEQFVHFYAHEKALQPKAVVYFDDAAQRARLEDALAAAGVETADA